MNDFVFPILSFVTGGGISTILSVSYLRKNSKLDYTEKQICFMEEQETKLLTRFTKLENRVTDLEKISCLMDNCNNRKPAI